MMKMKVKFEKCVWLMVFIVIVTTAADPPKGPDRGSGLKINATGNSPLTDAGISISTSTGAPTTTKPNKLRRDSGLLTDNDVDGLPAIVEGPPQIESRQGRLAPSGSVQTHRSNVAYTSSGGVRSPQGPTRGSPRPPAPPPPDEGPLPPAPPLDVTEIRCLKMASRERFSAVLSMPEGLVGSNPIFEDKPAIDPITSRICQIQPASRPGTFQLEVTNLDACGVKSCNQNGEPWLCVTLRFPVLAGLKLPEDEIVEIRCKQQDRTVAEKKDIDFDGEFSPRIEEKSPVTFTGGKQEFLCEIGLFRRLPGTSLFSQRIGPGSAVELGEEVQLRSIVRSNDGWFYSKLTDVVVRRLKKQTSASNEGSAILVLQDGCRNPAYRTIATQHPQRDVRSSLLNNFNFRVFLFQDMDDGDSIVISARVFACIEAIDCAPTLCGDDRGQGFGRRKRSSSSWNETRVSDSEQTDGSGKTREILIEQLVFPNGTVASASSRHLKGWETDLALRVAMPGDYYNGARAVPLHSLESHCFLYLMMTVGLGTALGVTTLLVSIYCMCTCKRRRNKSVASSETPSRAVQSPAVTAAASTALETLMMEACYPELQVLDALSRTVRQKKQNVHDEIIKLYGAAAAAAEESKKSNANVYSSEPRPSLKQVKRHRQQAQEKTNNQNVTTVVVGPKEPHGRGHNDALYWEIGQHQHSHQILPPTPV
ncbi:uncharacterized protein LOC124320586 isoform X2 [Daphnia pulicaria]|uniref:uncharacterized protein LOC124320586 isoform X2 n=1 Tax=Daphnia pulicaria TaxID=35523 RepID=UPI001EEC5CBC|nr:uncharacterized protein LOC124320586 isoform X2 [Daphnia pulicaria]